MGGASGQSDEEITGEGKTSQVSFNYRVEELHHTKRMSPPTHQFVVKFQCISLANDAGAAFEELYSD
jgi:hypothetical protein